MLLLARTSLLVDLAAALGREVDLDALLAAACDRAAAALSADRATVWLVDAEHGDLVTRVGHLPEVPRLRLPLERGVAGWVATHGRVLRVDDARADPRFDPSADRTTGYVTRSVLAAPIRETAAGPVRGVLQLLNRVDGAFTAADEALAAALAVELGEALALTTLRPADAGHPGLALRGPFNHIVGTSAALDRVYQRIVLAAGTDATVLLLGETGTGKSLFARAVHVNSPRGAGPFVTVDCTTLPRELAESELFGHERGAFTGADRRVLGKVERAAGGTLFLDEVGELSPEVQGKLLRLLQDREYERLGGRETLRADVRLLAATHRDLGAAVRAGTFREDLYYRLRVVEIRVPPLRERGGDEVLRLARHFAERYARRHRRPPAVFTEETCAALVGHSWPGNVRELEHWVESAVVLAPDGVLHADLLPGSGAPGSARLRGAAAGDAPTPPAAAIGGALHLPLGLPLDEVVRRYTEATVTAAGGNRAEAARRLGVGRNTLGRRLGKR